MDDCLFCRIVAGEIPATTVHETDTTLAFRDIDPKAPTHVLIVTNEPIPTAADVTPEDEPALGRLFTVARKIAEQEGIAADGYRLIVNCRAHGGQEVDHLHMHLVGGHPLGRMLAPAASQVG